MRKVDAPPDEEIRQPSQREQPGEDLAAPAGFSYESEQPEEQLNHNAPHRTAFGINVSQELRPHALRRQGLHSTRGAVGAGVGDTQHGHCNHNVEHRGQALDSSELDCQHERRSFGICA